MTSFLCFADTSTETVMAAAPNPDSLLAHYQFEGDSVDTSGLQQPANCTLFGNPTFGAGVFGLAISLDGDGDYVDCGNGSFFNITDRLTVTAWIKVGQFDKQYQTIISKGDNSWRLARAGKSSRIEFACNGTAANKWNGTGEVPWAVTGVTDVNDGNWHHIAGVFDGSGLYLYVDGILEAAKAAAKTVEISNYNMCIGANAQVPGRQWKGLIDDVRIYNYALSQAEILAVVGRTEINLPEPEPVPSTLFNIAKRYDGLKKREEAKNVCRLILQNYPESPYASNAQIYISKRNIISLIESKDYDEAQTQLDTLIADFNDHPDTAEALYAVAQAYSPPRKFKESEDVYKRLLQLFPDSSYAAESLFRAPKLHIFYLIQTGKNSEAMSAIDKFTADFAGHPALPGVIYWFAKEFEASKAYEQAKSIYQRAAWQYPDSSHASMSWIGFYRVEAIFLIEAGDDTAVQRIIDNLIADFKTHPELPYTILQIGEKYYLKSFQLENKDLDAEAREYRQKAIAVWERITEGLPLSPTTPEAYCFSARSYSRMGAYEKAIECYKKVVDKWSDFKLAGQAQFLIGKYYEELTKSGNLLESEAYDQREKAYKSVVENYPDCPEAKKAYMELGWLKLAKGQWADTVKFFELAIRKDIGNSLPRHILYPLGRAYEELGQIKEAVRVYNEFIRTVDPSDPRIEIVKTRLENLLG